MASSSLLLTTTTALMKPLFDSPPRSVASLVSSASAGSDFSVDSQAPVPKGCPLENPFLVRGRVVPYLTKEREDLYLAKFDLPGLSKEDLRVWVESNLLHFKGEEHRNGDEVESDDDDDEGDDDGFKGLRSYLGAIELPPEERFAVDQIRAELRNGVLKVVVPKLKLQDRNDVFLVNVD